MRSPVSLLLLLAMLLVGPDPASAEEMAFPARGVLEADLGRPARADRVEHWAARAPREPAEVRVRWLQALGRAGGVATWQPLREATADPDTRIRVAAAQGLARAGAWGGPGEHSLLSLLDSEDAPAAEAAARALGTVGTGRAVPALVARLEHDAPAVRRACAQALRRITGVDRGERPGRWRAWWRLAEPRLHDNLLAHLATARSDADEPTRARALHRAIELAWVDTELLVSVVSPWFGHRSGTRARFAALVLRDRPEPRLLALAGARVDRWRDGSVAQRTLVEVLRGLGVASGDA